MDNAREKLVELIEKASYECDEGTRDLYDMKEVADGIADFLIANGVTVQEWISVKDRLPTEEAKAHEQEWCEEYPEFLVMIERGLLPTTLYYDWENDEWFKINTALKREKYKVTHWMPLPQPPKGE